MEELKKIYKKGVLLIGAGILISTILFYYWFHLELNLWTSIGGTVLLLSLLFLSHRRLYLSCGIFTAATVLMFANIVFNSYYAGYLTVELLGSARFLGDVTDVIFLLIRPQYFIIFIGPVLAWTGATAIRRCAAPGGHGAKGDPAAETDSAEAGISRKARRICAATGIGVLALVVLNPLQVPLFQSISSTEMISYHLKDILKNTTGYGVVEYEAEYEMGYEPDETDPLFGIAEGRNLIVIQAEALQEFVIGAEYKGQELTPVLNELLKEDTVHFDQYYMQIAAGNTSDAEFATNNSIYGTGQSYTYEIFKNNAFRGLPWLLMERGYSTIAMHGYEGQFWSRDAAYETQGFQSFADARAFRVKGTETAWGINDEDFFDQAVDYLKAEKNPFYGFLITLSNHTPFELPEQLSKLELKEEHVGTMFGNYLRSVHYADEALGVFIRELKKAGLYDNSVIAIYGDHFGLSLSDEQNVEFMSEFLERPYQFGDMANVPLIIHIPGVEEQLTAASAVLPATVSVTGGQTDFLPTMAYLMGFEELDTLYMGRNLLAKDQEGFVIQYRYAQPGTFLTNDYYYMASTDGLFQNGKAYRMEDAQQIKLTEEMKELFQRSVGLSQLVHETLENDVLRGLYYTDGRPDRVETKLLERRQTVTVVPQPEDVAGEGIEKAPDDVVTSEGAIRKEEEILSDETGMTETKAPEGEENDGGNASESVI